jgi:hypothetical protein
MPFGGVWDEYYEQVYAPAILEAGLAPVRADEVFRAGSILQDIVSLLVDCKVVLADIADANRNVHYELGLAHALGKPTVLVAPRGINIFFDVSQERIITYSKDNAFWGTHLRSAIASAVAATLHDPASAIPTAFMHIKPERLSVDETSVRLRRIEDTLTELTRRMTTEAPPSRFAGKLQGLPAAEREAGQLLQTLTQEDAIRALVSAGYGQVMAETAVASQTNRPR